MDFKKVLKLAAVLGAISVILGAFGAHKLKELINEQSLQNWETGVRYQFYHTFAILLSGLLLMKTDLKEFRFASMAFLIGIILFSGSLYGLSLRSLIAANLLWLGPITPLGGVAFIIGWIYLFVGSSKIKLN
jgi:uncharacterized membrane protein YgdD (TMEM256/DUF423 family)